MRAPVFGIDDLQHRQETGSNIVKKLDEQLRAFARRRLDEPFPYLIVDARYEKVRENGVIVSQAVLIALGIDWEGRRQVLAVVMLCPNAATGYEASNRRFAEGTRP